MPATTQNTITAPPDRANLGTSPTPLLYDVTTHTYDNPRYNPTIAASTIVPTATFLTTNNRYDDLAFFTGDHVPCGTTITWSKVPPPKITVRIADNPINEVDPSGRITIYIHGVESDSTVYDGFVTQALKTWPASGQPAGNNSLQWRVYFNWSYADGTNPATNASDNIGDRNKAGSHMYNDGMSKQNWAASDKLRKVVDELHALITKYPCLKNEPINIVAHSQGTVITLSALQAGMKVDNVIFMGSPLDKEIIGDKSHNTDLPAGAKNAASISNFWSTSDDTARLKGGVGGFGLPASVVGGNISNYQMYGVDHYGNSGWWSGSWLAAQAKTAAGAAINKVIYGQKCDCGPEAKKEFQQIYSEAVRDL